LGKLIEVKGTWRALNYCPETKERLWEKEIAYNEGVCPRCGHQEEFDCHTETHIKRPIYVFTGLFRRKKIIRWEEKE